MAGYTVGINSETKAFKQGIDSGIIAPLEDAQDELLKLGKSRGPEELERAMKDAQDETKKLAKETEKTADAIEKDYKRAYREQKDAAKDGMSKSAEASKEFKDEALSNLSEVTSSFDGSMESVGDLVQGTFGGLASSLGPALGGAAAAAAAGVGVITEAFSTAEEAANDARDAAFSFAYDVQGALASAGYSERMAAWTGDTEKLKQAQDIAKVASMEVTDVIDALASGGDKLDGVWDAFQEGANTTDVATGRALELEGALKGTREGYLNGGEAAKLAAKLNYDYAITVGEATGKTDDLGNAIVKLPDGKEVVINADTKTAYEDLDAMEQRKITPKTVGVKFLVDDSAVQAWRSPQKVGYVNYKAAQTAWE